MKTKVTFKWSRVRTNNSDTQRTNNTPPDHYDTSLRHSSHSSNSLKVYRQIKSTERDSSTAGMENQQTLTPRGFTFTPAICSKGPSAMLIRTIRACFSAVPNFKGIFWSFGKLFSAYWSDLKEVWSAGQERLLQRPLASRLSFWSIFAVQRTNNLRRFFVQAQTRNWNFQIFCCCCSATLLAMNHYFCKDAEVVGRRSDSHIYDLWRQRSNLEKLKLKKISFHI